MFKQGHSLAWTQTFTFDGPVEEPERYVTSWVLFRPNTWRLTDIYFFQFIELLSRKYNPIMYCHIRDTYSWYIYIYRPFNSYHYYRIYTHLKKKTLLVQRAPWELCQASMGLFFRRITTFAFEQNLNQRMTCLVYLWPCFCCTYTAYHYPSHDVSTEHTWK